MIATRVNKACPCIVVQEDSWEHIMSYCLPHELCMIALTSKFLRKQSDKSESWYYWCQLLWKDKQYHPLERWVRLKPAVNPSTKLNKIEEAFGHEQNLLEIIENKIIEHEKQREEALSSIEESSETLADKELLNLLDGCISSCTKYKQVIVNRIDFLLKLKEKESDDNRLYVSQERLACPISRAVRAEWIQSTECEYFNVLDNRDVAEAKLSALSATHSANGNSTALLTNQKIFDSLLTQVNELQSKADTLKVQIIRNINKKVNMSMELANAAANGTLLTWKESYYASIIDSKRTTITPEELREIGEFITYLKGNSHLEIIRFVRGGYCITDCNSFKNCFGWFVIEDDEFSLPQLNCAGKVSRVASDWGWEFSCDKGINKIASFDRIKGFEQHEGVLAQGMVKHIKEPVQCQPPLPLTGGILENSTHPLGLYVLETV